MRSLRLSSRSAIEDIIDWFSCRARTRIIYIDTWSSTSAVICPATWLPTGGPGYSFCYCECADLVAGSYSRRKRRVFTRGCGKRSGKRKSRCWRDESGIGIQRCMGFILWNTCGCWTVSNLKSAAWCVLEWGSVFSRDDSGPCRISPSRCIDSLGVRCWSVGRIFESKSGLSEWAYEANVGCLL